MKTSYIDSEFKLHATNPEGLFKEVTLSENSMAFFAGKCDTFIEGYRLIPDGETWVREDGKVFSGGEMISPWKDYNELDAAQREYERQKIAEYEALIDELYAEVTE